MEKRIENCLPNLIVVGAMKCGTTSLHRYLNTNPEIYMSSKKEIDYFSRNYNRGLTWYQSHFPDPRQVRGESSTSYTKYPTFTKVPTRMHALIPEAKLIYIVRDPIERAISHYLHDRIRGREQRSIEEALTARSKNIYVTYSCYRLQLTQYLNCYPLESIFILETQNLRDQRLTTLRAVADFLGIKGVFNEKALNQLHNQTSEIKTKTQVGAWLLRTGIPDRAYRIIPAPLWRLGKKWTQSQQAVRRPVLSHQLRRTLRGYLQNDIDAFRQVTGKSFDGWQL